MTWTFFYIKHFDFFQYFPRRGWLYRCSISMWLVFMKHNQLLGAPVTPIFPSTILFSVTCSCLHSIPSVNILFPTQIDLSTDFGRMNLYSSRLMLPNQRLSTFFLISGETSINLVNGNSIGFKPSALYYKSFYVFFSNYSLMTDYITIINKI